MHYRDDNGERNNLRMRITPNSEYISTKLLRALYYVRG